jgi:hypothetical protein
LFERWKTLERIVTKKSFTHTHVAFLKRFDISEGTSIIGTLYFIEEVECAEINNRHDELLHVFCDSE